MIESTCAQRIHVRGIVQGVGFRPYVFRLAHAHALTGWVLNGADGVRIHVEGAAPAVDAFVHDLPVHAPPAACITAIDVAADAVEALQGFEIRHSEAAGHPATRISPDLPICDLCLHELFDPADRRFGYPYINCTNCGPRFSIIHALPYDRPRTTMAEWPLCAACANEYGDPHDRRFHAQPVACRSCGPHYRLERGADVVRGDAAIRDAAQLLRAGLVVAVKGLGGYHLACDAENAAAVAALRIRKYRKDKAFALMVRDLPTARDTVHLTPEAEALLASAARPIVLAPACAELPGVAPDSRDLGVMLPYAPIHHVLFAAGAPLRLVMTSGNRASEPIAYRDEDARWRLRGLSDALLAGERSIARRVDDSVARIGSLGPVVLRRSRGLAPAVVARIPVDGPVLAVGADLKNAITLVVDGEAYVSQHIGDLDHYDALQAFADTIQDLLSMYGVRPADLTVVHDLHPDYASTVHAAAMGAKRVVAVQHHRAHVASVLAERGELDRRVVGVAFDGTGYGDDGTIWGGEFFVGSVSEGFVRAASLRRAVLPGGDAAARHPVQAAAGFVASLDNVPDLSALPFAFPDRFRQAAAVVRSGVRTFPTTSAGRLFDTVAALVGFTRPASFEGQAAMWLEHLARDADSPLTFPMPFRERELDWRDTLAAVIEARLSGMEPAAIARAFHRGLACGVARAIGTLCETAGTDTVVLSGGVMQNDLLLGDIAATLRSRAVRLWVNHQVPPNDGGISLGQAALAAASSDSTQRTLRTQRKESAL